MHCQAYSRKKCTSIAWCWKKSADHKRNTLVWKSKLLQMAGRTWSFLLQASFHVFEWKALLVKTRFVTSPTCRLESSRLPGYTVFLHIFAKSECFISRLQVFCNIVDIGTKNERDIISQLVCWYQTHKWKIWVLSDIFPYSHKKCMYFIKVWCMM